MPLRTEKPRVSVIMPVYNAREYLEDAIKSILNQSYLNIELLIIDDGSSDGSDAVCDRYRERDPRVRVIHQTNHGLCYTRNRGLNMAEGEFIAFADHDDLYLDGGIEELVKVATERSVDLVKATYVGEIKNADGSSRQYEARMSDQVFELQDLANHYTQFNFAIRAMWNGLYRASIVRGKSIRFDETLKAGAEDYAFNLEYLNHVRTVGLTSCPVYKHFARENQSASVGFSENRQAGIVMDYHKEVRLLERLPLSADAYVDHQMWYLNMYMHEFCFNDTPIGEGECVQRIRSFFREMENFRRVSFAEKLTLFMERPKNTLNWELMHMGCARHLFYRYKKRHGFP